MKRIIISLLILLSLSSISLATVFNTDAYGEGEFSVSGTDPSTVELRITQKESGNYYWEASGIMRYYMINSSGSTGTATIGILCYRTSAGGVQDYKTKYEGVENDQGVCIGYPIGLYNHPGSIITQNYYIGVEQSLSSLTYMSLCGVKRKGELHVTFYTGAPNTINGTASCIDSVDLYKYMDSDYVFYDTNDTSSSNFYEFEIIDGGNYKLIFDDVYEYEFTCNGDDIVYNKDVCDYYTINLLDNCENLLINPIVTVYDVTNDTYPRYKVDPEWYDELGKIKLIINEEIYIDDEVEITIETTDGNIQYIDDVSMIEKNLYHPNIAWNLNVYVIDDNTESDISGASVTMLQDCCIIEPNEKYALTQTNGSTVFIGLANSNINLTVEKTGYTTYSNTLSIGSVFNCWSDNGYVTIRLNSTNDSSDEGLSVGCGVYFKNTDGTTTNTINDTDTYVDMYYYSYIGNATLKFQHQTYTYWYTDEEYTIINDSSGYHRILNANFSDYTNAYRGYIYNTSTVCNNIQTLNVINKTYEEETHYENLTSHCWIKNKVAGNQIDYRSDIKCVIYANSTNSTLLDITANFINGSTLVDSKTLNWADFVSGSPKWYYTWYPDYEYVTGYNYTLNITGFNGYQLDTDEVWTSDITGNELTVFVKDNYNQQIPYATIFVEDWGSIATGTHNYATITGLPDGDYQYKATKSGYISSGWATITLTEHESVTCVLVEIAETSVIGQKMSDEDIKSMFVPLMYILFIFMILGAFMYANK